MRRSLTVFLFLGCGARDALLLESLGRGDQGGANGAPISCEVDGIRLCNEEGPCPPMGFEACPPVGCTPVADRDTLTPEAAGVCWPDIDHWVNQSCIACAAGDACVTRAAGGLFCVPFELCLELQRLGAAEACRFADKSAFDGRPLASAPCPSLPGICSEGCERCELGFHCAGRSSSQPFGLCTRGAAEARGCDVSTADCFPHELCASFVVPSSDQTIADEYGVCVHEEDCLGAASLGVVRCYNESGRVDP